MQVYNILEPNNFTYPLLKEIYNDKNIVYHGTSSVFCNKIEKYGWKSYGYPYSIEDLKTIDSCFNDILYTSVGREVIRPYILEENKRLPSFTQNYWTARNYARNRGGETIHYIIQAIDEFVEFINDEKKIYEHNKELRKKGLRYNLLLDKAFMNLANKTFLEDWAQKISEIKKKYENLIRDHFPVVYAIRINPKDFPQWSEPTYFDGKEDQTYNVLMEMNELRPKVPINYDAIIAKINFPNGVQYWSQFHAQPLPLSWGIKTFISWYNKNMRNRYRIYYKEIKDYQIEKYQDLSAEYIGRCLIKEQIIPNFAKYEEKRFDVKFPKGSSDNTRRDITFHYILREPVLDKENKIIGWKELKKINKIDVISLIIKDRYGCFGHSIFQTNRDYP